MVLAAAATRRPLRHALFASAAIACAAAVWALPSGVAEETTLKSPAAPPAAVSAVPPPPDTREASRTPGEEKTPNRLMMMMLIDRVREIGPFGSLGQ